MAIGKNVKLLREQKGLTFDAVAKAVGTDAQAISQMEKRGSKTSNYAAQLAKFFGVSLEDLLSEAFDIEQALNKTPSVASQPLAQLQWVTPEEADLLSLFRACADAERGTVFSIARSLPKALRLDGARSDETKV